MKPNKDDFFDSMDIDRDWIHTEVLGQGRKKTNFVSNLTVILVLICTVLLIFIAFKDMLKKDDLSGLENTEKITAEKQKEADEAKAREELKAKEAAEAEAKKKAEEGETMVYTVKSGDTLAGIGAEFNVDFKKIAEANNLAEPYSLEVGQQLKIPGVKKPATTTPTTTNGTTTAPAASDGGTTYTVKAGDTLAQIGADLGVSYQSIADLNGLKPPFNLEVGQTLKIPKKQ